jgi:hypothetical protein
MDEIDAFAADVRGRRHPNPFGAAMEIVRGRPADALRFVHTCVETLPDGGTYLDAALSYLPEHDWPAAVAHALESFTANRKNEAAESVVAYAAMQSLPSLHPHLDALFRLRPNAKAYYENWPWRGSGTRHVAFLEAVIRDGTSTHDDRLKAWRCLLETRNPAALALASKLVGLVDLNRPSRKLGLRGSADVAGYFREVGVRTVGKQFRPLCVGHTLHLGFPAGYVPDRGPVALSPDVHPTWAGARSGAAAARFGGEGKGKCGNCGGAKHHLLTLDPVPAGVPVTKLPRVSFETCLSCLGWEEVQMFYRHDAEGRPRCRAKRSEKPPEFPAGPLRETEVALADLGSRWRWQDWALSNGRENLNRVGGSPAWVQGADYPDCPDCNRAMTLLLQLDSNLPTAAGGEWLWGSGGVCYGFWCDACKVSGFLWQCT